MTENDNIVSRLINERKVLKNEDLGILSFGVRFFCL